MIIKIVTLRWLSIIFLAILLCSTGITGYPLENNQQNQIKILDSDVHWFLWIDNNGYLVLKTTNNFPYDLYNVSYNISFSGGFLRFRVDTKTNASLDYLEKDETIKVKSNDTVVKPHPSLGRPVGFGVYHATLDEYAEGEYLEQHWGTFYCFFIFWFLVEGGSLPPES